MHRFMQWREILQLAPNVKAVKAIMRDYVDSLRPVIGTLPDACQRAMLGEELDVQAAAVTLLHEELRYQGGGEIRDLLHEIAHTFASAAVRITLLYARPVVPAATDHRRS